jgi:hypothetical protein
MALNTISFISLLFVALALGPSLCHLLEMPNKIHLSAQDYLTVQQIYRGWALLGFVMAGALLSTLILTFLLRGVPKVFTLTLIAFLNRGNFSRVLCFYISGQPANEQLDHVAGELAGASQAMGIFACYRRRSQSSCAGYLAPVCFG